MLLSELADEYALYLRSSNRSPQTVTWYRRYVGRFSEHRKEQGQSPDISEVTTRDIREYVEAIREGHAPRTVANHISALKTVLAFAVREGLLQADPSVRVQVPSVPKTDYAIFNPDDIDTLLRACNVSTVVGTRDFAVVILLFDSGIRAAELCGLRVDDVEWDRGWLTVLGKGSKERVVPVSQRTLRALRRYLNKRRGAGHVAEDFLFVNAIGHPMSYTALVQSMKRLGTKTNLHVHPHKFRHSFAVNALRNDAREFDIQQCLGHTTLQMTRHYARQSGEDLARRHRMFSPADRLKVRI